MKTIAAVLFALLISSCATGTPYQPYQPYSLYGRPSGGYSEIPLDKNVFLVSFSGNGYTLEVTATIFALLRSAEVALDKGFKYFVVLESKSSLSQSTYNIPSQSYTTITPNYAGGFYANTTTYGGGTGIVSRPTTMLTILCFKEKPDAVAFDAEMTAKQIRETYKLNTPKQPK